MIHRILIALGGNALKKAEEDGQTEEQLSNCDIVCKCIVEIVKLLGKNDRLVVTHGNGPQIGNLMVLQETARGEIPCQRMDILGAMTQGQIGYMLQQTLQNRLKDEGLSIPVCSIINQVLVDENDPEFLKDAASKPVGNFLTQDEAEQIRKVHPDYCIRKVKPIGDKVWRRCVPSPKPLKNIEGEIIRSMVDAGIIVIASGGGGIPVIDKGGRHYQGAEAVIDKDLAGELLAEIVGADTFILLTDVENVKLNYGRSNERNLKALNIAKAKEYLKDGQFLSGSMEPKILACIRFLERGGKKAVITSLPNALSALKGKKGTVICK